ncbi:MAG TPA: MoaD/ThiS family protein [Chitinophagaceae bacterium]|nr:MoaD/ThiS family protein [Chitinophagaceae bacterium]
MIINVVMFGIAREIFGEGKVEVEFSHTGKSIVSSLKSLLELRQPGLKGLGSYMIAVNNEYAADDHIINEKDEVAVIPPVSGG